MIKNNKGITIISLVISIIILGILLSVTLMNFKGDSKDDIIQEAKNTTEVGDKIRIKEEVLDAVMQSRNLYQEIDINKLNSLLELKNDISSLPANIETKDGYKYRIDKDGTIEDLN